MSKTTHVMANPKAALELLNGYSLEMTGKDVPGLLEAQGHDPRRHEGQRHLPRQRGPRDARRRGQGRPRTRLPAGPPHLRTAPRIARPARGVPRPPAGRRRDRAASSSSAATRATPEGPYEDSYDVIRTGLLPNYGVREVSIAGYPEGHPDISDEVLWRALDDKSLSLAAAGTGCHDPHAVRLRHRSGARLDRRRPRARASTARSASARPGRPASSASSASPAASASARTR